MSLRRDPICDWCAIRTSRKQAHLPTDGPGAGQTLCKQHGRAYQAALDGVPQWQFMLRAMEHRAAHT
jgi:hypothetical protein